MAAIKIRTEIVVRAGYLDVSEYGACAPLFSTALKRHPAFDINLPNQLDTRCVTSYGIQPQGGPGAVLADAGGHVDSAILTLLPSRARALQAAAS
jgi:hypothetical protein